MLQWAPSSLLKNLQSAAWGHAAYRNSSETNVLCRPGALTGRLFQQAPSEPRLSVRSA